MFYKKKVVEDYFLFFGTLLSFFDNLRLHIFLLSYRAPKAMAPPAYDLLLYSLLYNIYALVHCTLYAVYLVNYALLALFHLISHGLLFAINHVNREALEILKKRK